MSVASQVLALMYKLRPPEHRVKRLKDIDIESEDGVLLRTNVHFPRAKGPHPTILMRSPYGRRGFAMVADLFAERGYIVVLQAVRGTDGSTGTFSPLVHERTDGLATLDWIKKQEWFDGRIAPNGPSYLGYCALAIIDELPENAAVTIKATSADFERIVFPNGAFHMQLWLSWMQTIFGIQKKDLLGMTLRMMTGDIERKTKEIGAILPIEDADLAAVGHKVPFWREWMNNAIDNHDFWAERNHKHRLGPNTPPTSFVTGWFDLMAEGHLSDYQTLVDAGHRPHLTIGNWHHTDNELQGESLRQTLTWLDHHFLQRPNSLREKPVRIFISGSNRWFDLDQFPPQTTLKKLALDTDHKLSEASSPASATDHFTYDPADPTPSVGGAMFAFAGAGAQENNALEARADVQVYTSEPLTEPLTVLGAPKVRLKCTTTLEHADFFVRICDVNRQGKSTNVCDGIIRVTPKSNAPDADGVLDLEIDLGHCGHTFLPHHQIRLQVSGGAHPRYARNLGTDEPVATATKMVASDRSILVGRNNSELSLPIWNR